MSASVAAPPVDPFEEAFRRLEELGDKAVPANFMDEDPPKVEEEPAKAEEDPPKVEEEPAKAEEDPPKVEEEPAKVEEEPKPAPSMAEDALSRIAEALAERNKAPAEAPRQAEPPAEVYTADEKALISKYEEEWPDVAKAETLRRRAEYQQVVGYVFQQVAEQLGPLLERVDAIAQRTHLSDLRASVDDYETVREKVIDWVEKQPSYLRSAYTHVVEQGTAEEVADLVNRWKQDTGAAAKVPSPPAAPAKKAETELPPAAKQAAAALAPVSSKRSAVVQGVDPSDFDSAFAQAADQL